MFFITDDGYLISNDHVVKGAAKVRLLTGAGLIDAAVVKVDAAVVKVDAANDLALLKAVGRFAPLPIAASRTVKLGGTVATVGFPDIGLRGFALKVLAHGHHGGNRVAGGRGGWSLRTATITNSHRAAGQFGRGAGGCARERGGHRRGQAGCFGSIGHERLAPGECDLRGEKQSAPELLRVGAGRGGETKRTEYQG